MLIGWIARILGGWYLEMSVTGFGKIYTNILILALVDIDTLCGTDNTVVRNSLWNFVYLLHTGIGT